MMVLKVKDNEYKVKFGYNSFCDTDLMDRVNDLTMLFAGEEVENDSDVAGIGKIKDLFLCVRELIFVGCKKYNPLDSIQEVGDLLDEYREEETEEERGLMQLFTQLSEELLNEGFLADILTAMSEEVENDKVKKMPTKK